MLSLNFFHVVLLEMSSVLDYVSAPPVARDTRSNQELFTSLHKEIVDLGPRGVLVIFGVLFSSSAILLGRGLRWCFRKAAGYA